MELVWNGLLLATAMAGDDAARSRWEALDRLVRSPLPQGVTCPTGERELSALAAAPSDAARAGELAVALAERARAQEGFGEALAALWAAGGGVGEGAAEGAHVNLMVGGQHGTVMQIGRVGELTVSTPPPPDPAYLRDPGYWPGAGTWDGLAAGVHRARPGDDASTLPPYVARDCDETLRERLATAAHEGGLVLVTGDSTAGKTRAAFEALKAVLPGHRVLRPATATDVAAVARAVARAEVPCVVWLDDLERYLGPDGLTPGLLAELARTPAPVLATMRLRQLDGFGPRARAWDPQDPQDPEAGDARGGAAALGAQVLNVAERVDVDRVWSQPELRRAGSVDDSRIADAVAHHGPYGIAEYLAAGPALLQEWRDAAHPGGNPRGAALVAAAVDLARVGLEGPYPRTLLVEVHQHHLAEAGGHRLRPEGLDEAFAWAGELRYGATSLLLPAEDGDGWEVFDYLADHTEGPVPVVVWDAALAYATRPMDRFAVGHAAVAASLWHVAEAALRPLTADLPEAAYLLGCLLDLQERGEEAEELLRYALESGMVPAATQLGLYLARLGREREPEAEAWLRLAAKHEDRRAMFILAELLRQTDREEEAEDWYRRAADAGSVPALAGLGMLLAETGREGEAEEHLGRATDAGNSGAAAALGLLMARAGRTDDIAEVTRRFGGTPRFGLMQVGMALSLAAMEGNPAKVEQLYTRAAVTSRIEAADSLDAEVLLVRRTGTADDAYFHWRATRGDVYAALQLAGLVEDRNPGFEDELHQSILDAGRSGDNVKAAALARPAADAGDNTARSLLITALAQMGCAEEALPYARQAVAAGEEAKGAKLAVLLLLTGRDEEAERHWHTLGDKDAADAYSSSGYFRGLAEVARYRESDEASDGALDESLKETRLSSLTARECQERVEGYLRVAARLGHSEAAAELAVLLDASGRSEQATPYHRQAADGGHLEAAFTTAVRLEAAGDAEAAERYYRRAADREHAGATRRLRKLLARTGRRDESRNYRRRAAATARRQGRLEAGAGQKAAWILVVAGSLSLFAWVPFLYAAIRRGRRTDWWACGVFLLAAVVVVWGALTANGQTPHEFFGSLMWTVMGAAGLMLWMTVFDEPSS
ncbi:hypothetical protein U9R90_33060 [Streptomyces sp. E11-3]|uniref:hypothetical protein n=1 Tax=Streptomyces sp. E11-3 TaxID=3110112 RepID=UPI00397F6EE6